VDDEPAALFLRKTLLERAGYQVLTSLNAADALIIFSANTIDLVISDHLLPGLTGTEMSRRMKQEKAAVPILLLSGVAEQPEGAENTDKFLGKADGPEKLLQTVAELLRYRRLKILDRGFCAEIACDLLGTPAIWHCVIQRTGSADILAWTQARTEQAAVAAARKELSKLNRSTTNHRT